MDLKRQPRHSERNTQRNTQVKNGGNGSYQYDVQLQILNIIFLILFKNSYSFCILMFNLESVIIVIIYAWRVLLMSIVEVANYKMGHGNL